MMIGPSAPIPIAIFSSMASRHRFVVERHRGEWSVLDLDSGRRTYHGREQLAAAEECDRRNASGRRYTLIHTLLSLRYELGLAAFLGGFCLLSPTIFEASLRSADDSAAFSAVGELAALAQGAHGAQAVALAKRADPYLAVRVGSRADALRLPPETVVISPASSARSLAYVRSYSGALFAVDLPRTSAAAAYYAADGSYLPGWRQLVAARPFPWVWTIPAGLLLALLIVPAGVLVALRGRRGGDDGWSEDDESQPADPRSPCGDVPDYPPDFDLLPPAPRPERDLQLV